MINSKPDLSYKYFKIISDPSNSYSILYFIQVDTFYNPRAHVSDVRLAVFDFNLPRVLSGYLFISLFLGCFFFFGATR